MKRFTNIRKTKYAVVLIVVIVVIGITGFILIEDYPFIDSLYMTIITLATVGFKEVHPLSDAGKIFTVCLIISSLGTFAYAISIISTSFLEGELRYFFKDYRTQSEIKKMENHVIVCGYGRNAQQAVAELIAHKHPFVIVEQNNQIINSNKDKSLYFIEGDATHEDVLIKAGIKTAKAVITTLPYDADNLFVVITARSLKADLIIVSRASQSNSDKKLRMAGVNNVVMPEKVGGAHMATLVLKPDVVEFLNRISVQHNTFTNLEEIVCSNLPEEYRHKTISELAVRKKSGANIVGFKTPEGEYIINPPPDTIMIPNTKIFVLGTPEQIRKMKEIFHVTSCID